MTCGGINGSRNGDKIDLLVEMVRLQRKVAERDIVVERLKDKMKEM